MMRFISLVALVAFTRAGAQAVPTVKLAPANGTLNAEFVYASSVRELSDGRVLVTDPRDNRVIVGDFRAGTIRQVGRVGNGPNEYPTALGLTAIGGDSSLMMNGISKHWLIFVGDKITATFPPDSRVVLAVRTDYGADRFGNVLSQTSPPLDPRGEPINPKDSSALVLVSQRTGRADTIAKLWMGPPRSPSSGSRATYSSGRTFSFYDVPLLANDGWVAVVRHDPFRVDWRSPAGKWTLGKAITVPADPVTDADKAAFLNNFPESRRPRVSDYQWPKVFPAAPPQRLLATPEGKLLVLRYRSVARPTPVYYVIDRQGRLERQLELSPGENIVNFGKASVYVAAKDADDVVHLRRHPWP